MREINSEILISAPPDKVWEVLMAFSRYPEWNPFVREISGEARQGARLRARLQLPGSSPMTFKPRVRRVIPGREFRWLGVLFIPGLFDGEHVFELLPAEDESTRFVQRELFRGVLVPLVWSSLEPRTLQGFNEMNRALKQTVESGS
jgi:hypothetical protein